MIKKAVTIFLVFLLIAGPAVTAAAAEKIVRMKVPGCFTLGAGRRIGAILKKIDGVKKHRLERPDILIVLYDDEKTTLEVITGALEGGNFPVRGRPVYLPAF